MSSFESQRLDATLARLNRVKTIDRAPATALGPELLEFFKVSVKNRHAKFGKVADCWAMLVPVTLAERCALESFSRGTLTVIVDSSSHLYELKQLLLAGLEKQIVLACSAAGLKKVSLKRGRWYDEDAADTSGPAGKKLRF